MKAVLDYISKVINKARLVSINQQAILDFCKNITEQDFAGSEFNPETTLAKSETEEKHVALVFVYNALNFSYWGEPKWTIISGGAEYDGSAAMLRALKNAIDNGIELTNPQYLVNLDEHKLAEILRGNVQITLFLERLRLLKELGKIIIEKYNGSFVEVLKRAEGRASKIVELLVTDFAEIFNDIAYYEGEEVKFYKRAQIIPAYLFDLQKIGLISSVSFSGQDELTAFADYKVPQMLRKFGILVYAETLANKVDHKIEILSGSEEEIEIRASNIWAIELITNILKEKYPQATPAKVSGIFWFKGQVKSPDDKPYHRTRTIWY